jgi:hypothetical protein
MTLYYCMCPVTGFPESFPHYYCPFSQVSPMLPWQWPCHLLSSNIEGGLKSYMCLCILAITIFEDQNFLVVLFISC